MNKPFSFKQFEVHQDRCAMKIGTDGVLLGCWAPVDNAYSVLDIGAGTGVISLIIAQRSTAETIDAVEIDEDAYEQTVENFERSPWGDRLFCYHASFQEFFTEIDDKYDLIISNPPFYTENYKTDDKKRDLARFEDALPFEHLLYGSSKLLSDTGRLVIILPYKSEEEIITVAEQFHLYPQKITRVKGSYDAETKRSLIVLGFGRKEIIYDELVIEITRHQYTDEYIKLTKDFYLNM